VEFETYKLHAELAARISEQREDISKLHFGVVAGIVTGTVLIQRLASGDELFFVLPVLGLIVSFSWMVSIWSLTAKLSAKHAALLILEKRLDPGFRFLKIESCKFKPSVLRRKFIAVLMPTLFAILCIGMLIIGGIQICPSETLTDTTLPEMER